MAARRLLAGLGLLGGLILATGAQAASHAVVLTYHHVSSESPLSTSVTPETFEAHLDFLAENGFRVWSLSRVLRHLDRSEPLPEDTVVLTFDDAYESVYTEALPRLRRRDWPFTVFVSTDYIDRGYSNYMSWDQLRELGNAGGEIGNHSLSHPHLVRRKAGETLSEWRARVRREISGAQQRLNAETSASVKVFAYPFGEYDRAVKEVVSELGFYGAGQHSGAVGEGTDLTAIPRFPMAKGSAGMDSFPTKVRSRPLPVTVLAPEDRILSGQEGRPALRIRLGEGPFRLDGLACYASGQGRMELAWPEGDGRVVEIRPGEPLAPGRTKYNCTAPSNRETGVFHWFSYLWLKRGPDGSWYRE